MKIHGCFLVAIILLSCNLHAQQMFSLGFKGGIGASDIIARSDDGNLDVLFSPNLSYSIAGYIESKFNRYNKYLWFTVEPGYILKGAIHQDDIKRKMNYITITSMLMFHPDKNFVLGVGPDLGYVVKATHKYKDNKTNLTRNYNSFEYGAAVEAGYWMSMEWYVGLRYGLALNKMTEKPYDVNGNSVQVKEYNHYLHLTLRLRLYQQSMYGR